MFNTDVNGIVTINTEMDFADKLKIRSYLDFVRDTFGDILTVIVEPNTYCFRGEMFADYEDCDEDSCYAPDGYSTFMGFNDNHGTKTEQIISSIKGIYISTKTNWNPPKTIVEIANWFEGSVDIKKSINETILNHLGATRSSVVFVDDGKIVFNGFVTGSINTNDKDFAPAYIKGGAVLLPCECMCSYFIEATRNSTGLLAVKNKSNSPASYDVSLAEGERIPYISFSFIDYNGNKSVGIVSVL